MTRRVLIASPTYRGYSFPWVRGLVSLGWPEPSIAKRLSDLDVEVRPSIAAGYGGGHQYGTMIASALEQEVDFVLTIEWDHAWDARHVVRALEAERHLSSVHGVGNVAVGAMYPSSSNPTGNIVRPLNEWGSLDTRIVAAQMLSDVPESADRYVEASQLPAGFTLWPLWPFRGSCIEERIGLHRQDYWDAQTSALHSIAGVKLFVDLSLDVGHIPSVALTSLDLVKLSRLGPGRV